MVVGTRVPVRVGRCQADERDNPNGLSLLCFNEAEIIADSNKYV
jgi:hypothetical protein